MSVSWSSHNEQTVVDDGMIILVRNGAIWERITKANLVSDIAHDNLKTIPVSDVVKRKSEDPVEAGNYADPSTATNAQFGKDNGDRDFLFVEHKSRIRQNGTITQIKIRLGDNIADPDLNNLVYKVWRKNGSVYDLVGESDITALAQAAGPGIATIVLLTPITGVQEGDYNGILMSTGGLASDIVWNGDAANAIGTYFYSAAEAPDTGADFEAETSNANYVPIDCFMVPPDAVFAGDSIVSGASVHDSYINDETDENITSGWANQVATHFSLTYQNMGKNNGDGTPELLARVTDDMVSLKPRIAFIAVGTHDVNSNDPLSTSMNLYAQILDNLVSNGIFPVVIEIYPRTEFDDTKAANRRAYNTALASLVSQYGGVSINLDSALGQNRPSTGFNDDIQSASDSGDGIHPNATGHAIIATEINRVLDLKIPFSQYLDFLRAKG